MVLYHSAEGHGEVSVDVEGFIDSVDLGFGDSASRFLYFSQTLQTIIDNGGGDF